MNLLHFIEQFPDETSCKVHLRDVRERDGLICKKCNGTKHYWLKAKWMWQCSDCRFRTTLRSGTMMEHSNLPVRTWYLAMAFMTYSKKGISATELQRQLNHSRYTTIWSLMHKIRTAVGKRDDLYKLEDMVEFDEGYFEVATKEKDKQQLKRGRGSQRQSNVAVMAESTPLEDLQTGKKSSHCRYFKMKVLDTHRAEEVNTTIANSFDEMSIVFSDKSTSYVDISDYVEMHVTEKSSRETTVTTLKWVHIAISNAKRTLLGIYHKIKGKYLQNYLHEFCYKLNRRYFGERLFDRLVLAVSFQYWYKSV
ncbi:ISXO2 transposase-like protein [Gillisia sp. Hel_I_86]|uniref:IS1595 family transposase n=1 Tax=Gillisia sp. Hel_I_86 TaxID=1249981 RepID=UPI00119A5E7E|nr:IS1595 family transposase [Gillisia sp. Hel_I_86]TVZ28660.1 ISXO2 transposase-like protein [Gillisia sp. Hel_I_86]